MDDPIDLILPSSCAANIASPRLFLGEFLFQSLHRPVSFHIASIIIILLGAALHPFSSTIIGPLLQEANGGAL